METIADGIVRLGSRLHNFYLLIEGGKATAIDVPNSMRSVCSTCR